MQKVLGKMRKAIQEYKMIEDGDVIGVGVSGGKDSVILLLGLIKLREILDIDFRVIAISLDPVFEKTQTDFSYIEKLCAEQEIPFILERTIIGEVVFDIRKEANPCSLCARMRRGALYNLAQAQGCNKLALGHHLDDAVETFFMNLFNEGRIGCFSPITQLERDGQSKGISLIRPLILCEEKLVSRAVKELGIMPIKSKCPADKKTNRQTMKDFVLGREKNDRQFKKKILTALKKGEIDGF